MRLVLDPVARGLLDGPAVLEPGDLRRRLSRHPDLQQDRLALLHRDVPQVTPVDLRGHCGGEREESVTGLLSWHLI